MNVWRAAFHEWSDSAAAVLVLIAAAAVAVVGARSTAGGWNDGSRLATVESLVDRHTLAIDGSIFVQVPPRQDLGAPTPYPPDEPDLLLYGTQDKLLINGHFYSDKSPVPALLLAALYKGLQWSTGLTARERPDLFCYVMTLGSAGLAYVVAVWSLFQLGRPLRLPLSLRVALTGSFALATVAATYTRQVNNHILLLGVATTLLLGLTWLARETQAAGKISSLRLLGLGSLGGLGYTIDLGAGPLLLACALAVVAYRCRRLRPVVVFALAALPWLALHHVVNYTVGGTFRPANSVPKYLQWPGSPFHPQNMTGAWNHTVGHFLTYAAALLVGKRGFLGHNLPLFLALPGIVDLLRRRTAELPEIICAACWSGATWLGYALLSTNYSGVAASIRWFVPLLAPGYYVLAIFLRERPRYFRDFLVLSGWGAVVAGIMWWKGPWMKRMVPFFWPLQAAALLSWLLCRTWREGQGPGTSVSMVNRPDVIADGA